MSYSYIVRCKAPYVYKEFDLMKQRLEISLFAKSHHEITLLAHYQTLFDV